MKSDKEIMETLCNHRIDRIRFEVYLALVSGYDNAAGLNLNLAAANKQKVNIPEVTLKKIDDLINLYFPEIMKDVENTAYLKLSRQ
jgi:hypothetical protein